MARVNPQRRPAVHLQDRTQIRAKLGGEALELRPQAGVDAALRPQELLPKRRERGAPAAFQMC